MTVAPVYQVRYDSRSGMRFYGGNREAFYCRLPEFILSGPAETGKTFSMCWKYHLLAMKYPGVRGLIVHADVQQHAVAMPQVKAGRLRAVAVTSTKRSAAAPEMPTIAETVPGYEASGWYGAFAPAATPRELVAKINGDMNRAMRLPDVAQRLSGDGVEAVGTTPEQFGSYLRQEIAKWGKIVKASGAKAD